MLRDWLHPDNEAPPYSQLALIYDHVMRHVNYARWAEYLANLFSKSDIAVERVLDISCGTCSLLLQLHELGYLVAGLDESPAMIEIAKKKAKSSDSTMPIWCGSMQRFALKNKMDAIVSTYDSLNYCLTRAGCLSVFESAAAALRNGGLFVFDVCTEKNSRENFVNYVERDGTDDCEYVRQAYYLRKKRLQVNEFCIQSISGGKGVLRETHKQRIYRISEITKMIPRRHFELIGVYDGFTRRPGSEQSNRVHFVLKKVQSA